MKLLRVSCLALLLGAALSAQAGIITFESVPPSATFPNANTYAAPLSTQGYTFSSPSGEFASWTSAANTNTTFSNYTGSVAIFDNLSQDITLTKDDSNPFDLLSIDVANLYRQGVNMSTTITFTGTLSLGGTVTQDYTIPDDNLVHNVTLLGFTDLSSVVFSSPFNQFQIDNLSVVPEPASMAALGLGTLSLLRRKRRP